MSTLRLPTPRLSESRLLRLLAWTPVPLSATEIGALLKVSPKSLLARLGRMHADGKVERSMISDARRHGRGWTLKWKVRLAARAA